jgi:hypothetical protein
MVEKLGGADLKFGHYRNGAEPPASFLGERKAGPTGEGEDARFGKRPLQERGVRFTHDEKGRRADPVKTFGMRTPHIKRSALHLGMGRGRGKSAGHSGVALLGIFGQQRKGWRG